jgi:hypothetical protein
MRTKYSDEEVDNIEIQGEYFYSESLMKAGLNSRIKQAKSNKEKGYKPSEKGPKKMVYGIILMAWGDDIFYDCSHSSDEEMANDDVIRE